jgi:hypothetical protein
MSKKIVFLLLVLGAFYSNAKAQIYCGNGRYINEIFTVGAPTTITYGNNLDVNGNNVVLTMDVYQPQGDTCQKRPVLFFTHGGSFIGGSKGDGDVVVLCQRFAKRGYVTVSINYRLGMGFPINQQTASSAVYRGTQDMRAAVRYMRKDAATTNQFKIEPNYIFGGGSSAGAFCALHLAYLDEIAELGTTIDTTAVGCGGGGLEGLSGNPGYASNIKAVVNLCGALGKKEWMKPNEEPLCSMHGTADNVVPYGTSMIYVSGVFPIMIVDGSHTLDSFATAQGGPYSIFHSWAGANHVPYASDASTMDYTVGYVRDFLAFQLGCGSDPEASVGISNTASPLQITASPNPASDNINVILEGYENQLKSISLLSLTGQQLQSFQPTFNQITIHRNAIPKGLYLLQLTLQDGTVVTKKIAFD